MFDQDCCMRSSLPYCADSDIFARGIFKSGGEMDQRKSATSIDDDREVSGTTKNQTDRDLASNLHFVMSARGLRLHGSGDKKGSTLRQSGCLQLKATSKAVGCFALQTDSLDSSSKLWFNGWFSYKVKKALERQVKRKKTRKTKRKKESGFSK